MFTLEKKLKSGIRIGKLSTPHGIINTPFFMPVGTVGSVKSVSPEELEKLGAQIVLSNTYHLYLRPGEKLVKELGGLHSFMRWSKPILTDSGGYQVFSLAKNNSKFLISNFKTNSNEQMSNDQMNVKCQMINGKSKSLVKVTDDGVEFTSHLDGSKHLFTPEKVIDIQLDLGVDILMPLDVCPSGKADKDEVERAVKITTEWAKRAKEHFEKQVASRLDASNKNGSNYTRHSSLVTRPLLHGIVQGGLYEDLRRRSAKELIELNFDGYSIGGLAVDLETRDMWDIIKLMGEILPEDKQRYLMGVGTPDDIIKAVKLGVDMFDCVLPTRLARHGSVYVRNYKKSLPLPEGEQEGVGDSYYVLINLLNSKYRTEAGVIDENCNCPACAGGFSKAYISHLLRCNEILGLRLATLHNLQQYLDLMQQFKGL